MISEALLSGSIGPATEARGGTEAEVLSLALLVVCGCDVDDAADRAVRHVVRRRYRRFAGLPRRRAVDFAPELAGRRGRRSSRSSRRG